MGQIANRQPLVFSERGQLSQAIPRVHVERIMPPTNANRAIRIAVQWMQGLRVPNSVFLGRDMTANDASDSNRCDNSR